MANLTLSSQETQQIWQQACSEIQPTISDAVFNTWVINNPVTEIELVEDTGAICTITSPTAFHSTNLKKNLGGKLEETLSALLGRKAELNFKIGTPVSLGESQKSQPGRADQSSPNPGSDQPQTNQISPTQQQSITPPKTANTNSPRVEDLFSQATIQSAGVDRLKFSQKKIGLRSDYTFETFAVSTTNEMAHAAATAVSQRPGSAYNPLFLYGGVGVGKTHLMHSIANNILQADPDTKVIYCTGEEFTNEIVSAIRNKNALRFKEKYRNAQVLMVDDIQFIAGKSAVQEEFFHTFNALTQQARQIVATSDKPPHEINLMEDRLRSRFEAGLMVDIQQPTFELRTAILLIKTKSMGVEIPMDIAQLISSKVDSARKIEGIIKSIRSAVELQNKEITSELVEEIIKNDITSTKKRLKVTPNDIIKSVANHYHVKQTAIRGKRRVQTLVNARHVAMYLLKEELNMPLTEIGRWFSNRDHTTALHATRKIEKKLLSDELLQRDVSALRMNLSAVSR